MIRSFQIGSTAMMISMICYDDNHFKRSSANLKIHLYIQDWLKKWLGFGPDDNPWVLLQILSDSVDLVVRSVDFLFSSFSFILFL